MQDKINPNDFGYLGDERFEISANEFQLLKVALEKGFSNTLRIEATEVPMFLDAETGMPVENPSEENLALGKILVTTNKEATFSQGNIKYTYDMTKLTREMLMAQELLVDIHLRNVETNVAKPLEELKIKLEKVE
jgi:hypothetical protein